MSITKSLEKAIRTIATQIAHDSPFDKTRSGVVIGYNAKENKYNITVDGVKYNNIPIVNGLMARVNDVVRVLLPNGNVSQMFIYGVQTSYSALIGEIKPYAGSAEPTGWLICDGRAISRTDYQLLFDVIGTTYGDGDESTTFNLPDLSGRTLIGTSTDYQLADVGGSEYIQEHIHEFTQPKTPNHTHTLTYAGDAGSAASGSNPSTLGSFVRRTTSTSTTGSWSTNSTGGGVACTGGAVGAVSGLPSEQITGDAGNMQPYLAINYLIYTGGVTF